MTDIEKLMDDLRRTRDEMRLQLHLASKEAKDEWDALSEELDQFASRAQLDKSADEIGDAMRDVGRRLKDAYERLKNASN